MLIENSKVREKITENGINTINEKYSTQKGYEILKKILQ
jgi:hypothetical protein